MMARMGRFIRDEDRARIRDEILDSPGTGDTPESVRFRSQRGRKTPTSHRAPLLLLLDLMGSAMSTVPANAWKVVCYVAAKQIGAEVATGARATVAIPLAEFSVGIPRRTTGTGLSKSSVAAAITAAVDSGILWRERRRASNGGNLPTEYGINWPQVAELARRIKSKRKNRSGRR